jgi:hypothetical protein
VRSLPIARRIAEAFKAEPPTETEVKLVQVLLDHPLEYPAREQADICSQATLTSGRSRVPRTALVPSSRRRSAICSQDRAGGNMWDVVSKPVTSIRIGPHLHGTFANRTTVGAVPFRCVNRSAAPLISAEGPRLPRRPCET